MISFLHFLASLPPTRLVATQDFPVIPSINEFTFALSNGIVTAQINLRPPNSLHVHPAVHRKHLAGDVTRVRPGEEDNRIRHFRHAAQAAHRRHRLHLL